MSVDRKPTGADVTDWSVWMFPGLVVVYFALHALARLWVSPYLELDEAALFITSEELRLGYGAQFPLYDWLQWAVFQVTGRTLGAVVWTKTAVLILTVWAIYAALVRIVPVRIAACATAALVLAPEFSWEAQRTLSHSVALVACVAGTIWAVMRILTGARAGLLDYALLGLIVGLGLLSKPNFWLLLVGMVAAGFCVREIGGRFSARGLAVAAAVALAIAAVPYGWMAFNLEAATSSTPKFTRNDAGVLPGWLNGPWQTLIHSVVGVAPFLIALAVLRLVRGKADRHPEQGNEARRIAWFFVLAGLAGLAVLAVAMAAAGATHVASRWMLPMVLSVVPFSIAVVCLDASLRQTRVLGWVLAGLIGIVLVGMPTSRLVASSNISPDYAQLLAALPEIGPEGAVLAGPGAVVGNLIALAPEDLVSVGAPDTAGRPVILLASTEEGLIAMADRVDFNGAIVPDVVGYGDIVDPARRHELLMQVVRP